MSDRRGGFFGAVSRFARGWRLPALSIVLMLGAMAYWLAPRRTHDVVSTDGRHQWQADDAPQRRSIVWQPAVPLEARPQDMQPGDSLIRPRLVDDATTLYFTVRSASDGADMFRAEKTDAGWQPAIPLDALNTPADEIGPEMAADGSRLFFYSDRPGGEGGFDIYVSDRTQDGWGSPRNLGPAVNTPADDIDPALSPDGSRLYLASNRTPQMQSWIAEATSGDDSQGDAASDVPKPWTATLRAQKGLRQFDLYLANFDRDADRWEKSLPLAALNRSDSSEGAPHVDPTGTWMLFASDRDGGQGDAINFDIYRARLRGDKALDVENLGPGVNGPANETEPALSPEGFRLVFSSDRIDGGTADDENSYRLYSSTAIEVEETIAWDDENWQAFLAFLASNWWLLVFVALVAALLAAIVWYMRSGSFRRAPVPGFLLMALLLHVLGGAGSFYVFVPGARDFIDEKFIVLKEIVIDEAPEPEELELLEETPELKPVNPVETEDLPKQVVETTNVPRAKPRAAPQLPTRLTAETIPQESVLPKADAPVQQQPNLDRVALALPSELTEKIEQEQIKPIESTDRKPPAEQKVQVELADQRPQPLRPPTPTTPQQNTDVLPPRRVVKVESRERIEIEPISPPKNTIEDSLASRSIVEPLPTDQRETIERVESKVTPVDRPTTDRKPAEQTVKVELAEQQPQTLRPLTPTAPQQKTDTLPPRRVVAIDARERLDVEPISPAKDTIDDKLASRSIAQPLPNEKQETIERVEGDVAPVVVPSKQRPSPLSVTLQLDGDLKAAPLTPPIARSSPTKSVPLRLGPLPTEFKNAAAAPQIVTSSVDGAADAIPTRRANFEVPEKSEQIKTLANGSPAAKKVVAGPKAVSVQVDAQPGPSSPAKLVIRGAKSLAPVTDVGRPQLDATNTRVTDAVAPSNSTAKVDPLKRSDSLAPADAAGDVPVEKVALGPAAPSIAKGEVAGPKAVSVQIDAQPSSSAPSKLAVRGAKSLAPVTGVGRPRLDATNTRVTDAVGPSSSTAKVAPLKRSDSLAAAGSDDAPIEKVALGPAAPSDAKGKVSGPKSVSVQIDTQPGSASPSKLAVRRAKSRAPVTGVGRPQLDASNARVSDTLTPSSSTAKAAPLKRSGSLSPNALSDEPIKTVDIGPVTPSDNPAKAQPGQRIGVETDIERDTTAAKISAATLDRLSGAGKTATPRVEKGQLARDPFEAPLGPSDPSDELARRTLDTADLQIADERIGLQQVFRSRRGEAKRRLLRATGGNDQTELAVQRGLSWLEKHQAKDGRWTLHRFGEECKRHGGGQCNGHGSTQSDAAATGFALLPFLGAGNTHRAGDYRPTVDRALKWLVSVQKPNGDLYTGGNSNGHMYSHAIAAIALCEAYGMTGDPALRGPAQKAIDFIVAGQHKPSGGWRYRPNERGDTSVVGWQVMALKSGQMATPPLKVPQATLDGAKKWLDSVEGQGNNRGQFGYQDRNPKIAMTAEGLLCRKYLGGSRDDTHLRAGADFLLKHLPKENTDTSYYWYYATQFMYHMKGDYWKQWNAATRDLLVRTQQKSGPLTGTWNPNDNWEKSGGRLFSTSLRLLMLEVYYRHDSRLPLYLTLE